MAQIDLVQTEEMKKRVSHDFPIISGSYNGEHADYHAFVVPRNQYGIHARPAALIVKTASRYDCDAYIKKDRVVSAKSLMGLMTLEASKDTPLMIWTIGNRSNDSQECIEKLVDLFNFQFGED